MLKKIIALFLITGVPAFVMAQPQAADKIVGVVGNKIILQSDIDQQFKTEQQDYPDLPDSAKCDIMYNLLAQQILVEQAGRDSIIVPDDQVEGELDQRIRYFIQRAGSEEAFVRANGGRTVYQLKNDFRPFFRDKATAELMQSHIMQDIKITPTEVKAFYDQLPQDSLPMLPATVEMGQIVIKPVIDPEVDNLAKEKLEGIRKDIVEGGKSFETMASIYSMDGTKDNGGLLVINRKDAGIDPQFVAAAYRLQPGEISPVIKSKFGYHIIKMERRMGDEAQVRHIVIIPEVTNVGLEKTLKKMDSIRADLISGKISFSEAVGKYSTDDQSKMTGGMVYDMQTGSSTLEIDKLDDPGIAQAVSTMKVGEYSVPQTFTDPQTQTRECRILYLKSRTEPHVLNLKDDYNNIQQVALQKKQKNYLRKWLNERIDNYYIRIDPAYQQCDELRGWNMAAAGNNTSR